MFTFLKNRPKKGTQPSHSFYAFFISIALFIALALIEGGRYFSKNREATFGPSPAASSLTDGQTKQPTKDGNETEEGEDSDEESASNAQGSWKLLKTALPPRYYERSFPTSTPSVAFILTGLGLNKAWTAHVLATVKKKVTFAFSPYSPNIHNQFRRAATLGQQVLITLPLEPYHFPNPDPGPFTLLTGVKAGENIEKIKAVLEKSPKGVSVIGEYGSRFTSSPADLEPVLKELNQQGRVFIDPNSSLHSQTQPISVALGMVCHKVDLTLPMGAHSQEIDEFFKKIIQNAKENGTIIVSIPAIPVFISHLLEWISPLEKNGINFVTVADLRVPKLSSGSPVKER